MVILKKCLFVVVSTLFGWIKLLYKLLDIRYKLLCSQVTKVLFPSQFIWLYDGTDRMSRTYNVYYNNYVLNNLMYSFYSAISCFVTLSIPHLLQVPSTWALLSFILMFEYISYRFKLKTRLSVYIIKVV